MPRLFIAVKSIPSFEPFLKEQMKALGTGFGTLALRWEPSDKHHLSLAFLGETESTLITELEKLLAHTARRPGIEQVLDAWVWLPPGNNRRVLALRGRHCLSDLAKLHEDLHAGLQALGLVLEKRTFLPHVTVARLGPGRAHPLPELGSAFVWPIQAIHLYESKLTHGGSTYTVLKEFPLAEP